MIVSFSWTTPALLAGRKTRTRRQWDEKYAARFHVGDVCQAYDKGPRNGGKRVGYIKITGMKRENVALMPEEDFEKEGFAYLEEQGFTLWEKPARKAFDDWIDTGKEYLVVDFEKLDPKEQTIHVDG